MRTSNISPSHASGNPAVLFNMLLGFILAMQGNTFWLDSPLRGNDAIECLEVS